MVLAYACQQFFAEGRVVFEMDKNFNELWLSDTSNKWLLSFIFSPVLMLRLLSIYCVIKVLSLFQQGIFYSPRNFIGYFGFVWSQIGLFFYTIITTFIYTILNTPKDSDALIELQVDFGNISTLLFMLVLIYLLKVGKEVDDENKEFI